MSEWPFIIASYAIMWGALVCYVGYLSLRERALRNVPLAEG